MTTTELHLDNLQTGTEIVTITPNGKGFKYGLVKVLGEYSENHKKWRLRYPNENRDIGLLPTDGKGYYAMHSKEKPHFYYSANPKHIKDAKKAHKRAVNARLAKENKDAEKLKEFKQKLDDLLLEYGASIYPQQLSGDDHGVEIGMSISIGSQIVDVDWD